MNYYLERYFNLLINTTDMEQVEMFLPTMVVNGSEEVIDLLINKLKIEIGLAKEYEELVYMEHLNKIVDLFISKKEKVDVGLSTLKDNVLIFDEEVLKDIKKFNDVLFYQDIKKAIENLESKEWMEVNKNNIQKYRRLHGTATGLSEVKTSYVRLLHMPINSDFWYVVGILKKEGNNKNGYKEELSFYKEKASMAVDKVRKLFTKDKIIDIIALTDFAVTNSGIIKEELSKWGGKKDGRT